MDGSDQLTHTAMMAIMSSLTPLRQSSVKKITSELVNLRIPKESVDAIVSAVILEAAESQYVDEGGAVPPPRESSVDILKNLFAKSSKNPKKQEDN